MSCESCCDGNDLGAGDSCSCCGRTKYIVGYRKCEHPMSEADEQDIPITGVSE